MKIGLLVFKYLALFFDLFNFSIPSPNFLYLSDLCLYMVHLGLEPFFLGVPKTVGILLLLLRKREDTVYTILSTLYFVQIRFYLFFN